MCEYGYIYIRRHKNLDYHHVCKVGKTINVAERDQTYATNEYERGHFCSVFRFEINDLNRIDNQIKSEFMHLNKRMNGGTEFFDLSIIDKIEIFFVSLNIKFYSLTTQEIQEIMKHYKLRQFLLKKLCAKKIKTVFQSKKYKPNLDQKIIVKKTTGYLKRKNKGILCLPCGVGKTLISLFVAQDLQFKSICVGVPNILLSKQWEKVVKKFYPRKPILCVRESVTKATIKEFLQVHADNCILITTYSSSKKVSDSLLHTNYKFDFKINDEVHHITTSDFLTAQKKSSFIQMLSIPSNFQLSLTATPKYILNELDPGNGKIVSNNSLEHFGEIIEKKSLLWAISRNLVCDYKICVLKVDEERMDTMFEKIYRESSDSISMLDKRLFLSAICAVNSLKYIQKILIYTNSKENSERIIQYISDFLINRNDIFFSEYNSNIGCREQKAILDKFESFQYSIISCVYCLGEGYDFPQLDGVIFAENMSSNIRIVQSALRPCRKNKDKPDKIAHLFLPIIDVNDFLDNSQSTDLEKVRKVIYEMGSEDECVCEKITFQNLEINVSDTESKTEKTLHSAFNCSFRDIDPSIVEKITFRIFDRETLGLMTFENAKKFLSSQKIVTKKTYVEKFKMNPRLPIDPELFYGTVFNWTEYLSIPDGTYYSKAECCDKIQQLLFQEDIRIHTDYSQICELLHDKDPKFPPREMWIHFYMVDQLDELFRIQNLKKKTIK